MHLTTTPAGQPTPEAVAPAPRPPTARLATAALVVGCAPLVVMPVAYFTLPAIVSGMTDLIVGRYLYFAVGLAVAALACTLATLVIGTVANIRIARGRARGRVRALVGTLLAVPTLLLVPAAWAYVFGV